jgi:hypothetical protein
VAALAYGAALLGATVISAPSALADNGPGTLNIVLPNPNGVIAQGPVGAHVSFTGNGTAGDAYAIGYTTKDTGCGGGYKIFTDAQSIQSQGDGGFAATVTWPSEANAVGTQYVLCAHDNTNTNAAPIQSSTLYQVVAAKAPEISIQAVDLSTPTPGTLPAPTPKPGHYYAGNGVRITGSNFAPAGTQLQVYLAFNNQATPQNLQAATPLSTPDNSPITSGDGGSFTATVTLPNQTGNFYLLVVSSDHTDHLSPSLQASKKVTLGVQPVVTPTPTPSPSPSPSATTTTGGTGTGTDTGGPGHNTAAVVALGGLSIILFVVGVLLLASTVAGPRPRAPQM